MPTPVCGEPVRELVGNRDFYSVVEGSPGSESASAAVQAHRRSLQPHDASFQHASIIPAPEAPLLSVPDHVTAELLYNFHNSHHSPSPSVVRSPVTSWCKILTPPQEFGTLKGKDDEEARSATTTTSATSPRRCVSYQYVNMGGSNAANTSASNASGQPNKNNSPEQTHAKCRFCDSSCSAGGSRCHSPRSSDSEHGTDAAGGGQRSQLRHSRSSHNIGRVAPLLRDDSEFNFTDSGQYDHHQHHGALAQATTTGSGEPNQTRNNTLRSEDSELGGGMMKYARSRSEERVSDDDAVVEEKKQYCTGRSRIVVNLTGSGTENGANEHKSQTTIYRTGLYAHWWKKEKLPIFVVGATTRQGAAEERRNEVPGGSCGGSGDHFVDGGGGGDGRDAVVDVARGSGKRFAFLFRSMSPPTSGGSTGNSHPSRGSGSITQHMSQHKRSQSFNHHLSYNQVQQQQQQQHQSQKLLLSNFAASRISTESGNPPPSLKGIKEKANWNITNLRPAPPLRPALLNGTNSSGSGTGSTGGGGGASIVGGGGGGGSIGSGSGLTGSGSVYHSLSLGTGQSTKAQPTYEEDALVLRVIEAYCAAYQSNARNTMHSALQPWAPVLPIRGGKLKTSRHFSSSNPQLPFTCSTLSSYLTNPAAGNKHSGNSHNTASTNSINTSHIWREASPNNFNMYSASICSLNSSAAAAANCRPGPASRYSVGGYGSTEWRSHSEEKPGAVAPRTATTTTLLQPFSSPIARSGSNYDNIFMNNNTNTPLLSRVSKQQTVWMNANQVMNYRQRSTSREMEQPLPRRESPPPPAPEGPPIQLPQQSSTTPLLYDRRLNRSFETAQGLGRTSKVSHMRRSTPQLNGDDDPEEDPLRDDASPGSDGPPGELRDFEHDVLKGSLLGGAFILHNSTRERDFNSAKRGTP
ncbi:hypothetical protein pipiens_010726 [Culex pipiens pipiens]|uniref:Uncharacterized protein n=1 Tax=Culex pipiens pipiens TaxID=38569 RepID=A0ABD1D918_CULPP